MSQSPAAMDSLKKPPEPVTQVAVWRCLLAGSAETAQTSPDGCPLVEDVNRKLHTEFGSQLSEALANGRTPASLVVLSACDSGAYEMLEGDYPVGAAPALLIAGAAHCACTRFPVDAFFAKDFVCAFGRLLLRGESPAVAFAGALEEMEQQKYGLWRHLACIELLSRGG